MQGPVVSDASNLSPRVLAPSFTFHPHYTPLFVTDTNCIYLLISNHILGSHALLMINIGEQKMPPNDLENQVSTFLKSEPICSKANHVRAQYLAISPSFFRHSESLSRAGLAHVESVISCLHS